MKAFKFKLNPTIKQAQQIDVQLNMCRFVYNCALEERIRAYKKGVSLSYYDQQNQLLSVKAEMPEFKEVHSQVLQTTLKRLDNAYQAFFRRVKRGEVAGFPRFQGKDRFDSMLFPQWKQVFEVPEDARRSKTHAYIPKVGNVRINVHRSIQGTPKTATLLKDGAQ